MSTAAIWIVDFGSQYTQLITRKTRELGFSSEIITVDQAFKGIEKNEFPQAIILSGGPDSLSSDKRDYSLLFSNDQIPILGICYGMQIMTKVFGGEVEPGVKGEYGHSDVFLTKGKSIKGLAESTKVWMSHADHVAKVPLDFDLIMKSSNDLVAAIQHKSRPLVGLQFHPEVEHTINGKEILLFFFEQICGLQKDWNPDQMLESCLDYLKVAENDYVLCAFSGGVDSLVAATAAHQVLGDRLYCFFVDNGLLRPQDYTHIETLKRETPLNIEVISVANVFLDRLAGVDEPEKKRKIIGNTFIEIFEQKVHQFERSHNIKFRYLLQGTLYPDVIESISPHESGGKSVTIKSHHNVGGLPEKMNLKLLEPLRYLFKDEVRQMATKLELEQSWVHRHPFPGPGIGVRVLGNITEERVRKVQQSDQILFEELHRFEVYNYPWQAFTVLLPVKTVGVKGDARAYEEVICLRLVHSSDGMTATWCDMSFEFLKTVSGRITNEVSGITRVVYDITSKPPGTIEWE